MEQRFGFFNPRILQRAATLRRAFVRGVCPLAGLVLAAVLASACRPDAAAFSYAATPVDGWQPTDTLRFPVDSLREEGSYSLTLGYGLKVGLSALSLNASSQPKTYARDLFPQSGRALNASCQPKTNARKVFSLSGRAVNASRRPKIRLIPAQPALPPTRCPGASRHA